MWAALVVSGGVPLSLKREFWQKIQIQDRRVGDLRLLDLELSHFDVQFLFSLLRCGESSRLAFPACSAKNVFEFEEIVRNSNSCFLCKLTLASAVIYSFYAVACEKGGTLYALTHRLPSRARIQNEILTSLMLAILKAQMQF